MFGGVWRIPRGADQQFKLAPEELLAQERRTHPCTCEQDHIDPVIYTALEIRAQVNRGERPAPEQVGIFWPRGDGVFWTRQTRTWDLPSLTGVYAHRFTFKYIYSAWTTFPLIVKTQRRGRNAEGSTSDKWMGNIIRMRKEAVPFLESPGIPKPQRKEEWSYIFKEMGTFLAAKNFIVNCPLPVMEMPVAPIHDSKEALRFRAICDERITLPLASLKAFDSVYTKLVAGLSKSSMVEVKRCERGFKRYGFRRTGYWSLRRSPHCRRTRTPRRTRALKRMTRWTPSRRPRWWPYLWKPRCPRPWRPEGEAKDRALARALSTDWHLSEMAGVPDCPSEMALSVCTPVLQFLRV